MLGKVAPPVDHQPTHLPIPGAGEGEREVEQGQLVPVADTFGQKWSGHQGEMTFLDLICSDCKPKVTLFKCHLTV